MKGFSRLCAVYEISNETFAYTATSLSLNFKQQQQFELHLLAMALSAILHDLYDEKNWKKNRMTEFISDAGCALYLVLKQNPKRTLQAWVYTPVGVIATLIFVFSINTLVGLSSVHFPAAVLCLLLLFVGLLAWEAVFGGRKAKLAYAVAEVPLGFGLRFLNVFFTPSFVLLPLSPAVKGVEVAKIIGIFLGGFFLVLPVTALITRQLHLRLGTSKRHPYATSEQQGEEESPRIFDRRLESEGQLPLTDLQARPDQGVSPTGITSTEDEVLLEQVAATSRSSSEYTRTLGKPGGAEDDLAPLQPAAEVARVRGPGPDLTLSLQPTTDSTAAARIVSAQQQPLIRHLSRAETWAAKASPYLDTATYTIFFLVGAPLYLAGGPAFLMQLSIVVLAYFIAVSFPVHVRKYLHPVLSCSAISVLAIYLMSLLKCGIHGLPASKALDMGLHEFKTGERYLQLLAPNSKPRTWPGAGDILGSLLDVGIVGLALPMWTYRRELKEHYPSILIPNIVFSVGSLFAYPAVCSAVGLAVPRSLAFAARSVTLALATPAVSNLQGDQQFVAVIGITTGITGVLLGGRVLKLIKIPLDDYVTRGVSLGSVSSAITTAQLLTIDPRAAALSSLSMVVFGVSMVALTVVPPIVKVVWAVAVK